MGLIEAIVLGQDFPVLGTAPVHLSLEYVLLHFSLLPELPSCRGIEF